MRKNALFAVLTAAIVAVGIYAVDIAAFFGMGTSDERLVKMPRVGSNAVLLSDRDSFIDPMAAIDRENAVPAEDRDAVSVATAMVKAMAHGSGITSIAWGVYTELFSSWQDSGDGFVFVDGWVYINGNKNRRLLDCIVDKSDYSVVYIRFYSEDDRQPSADEMNRGLERLDSEIPDFFAELSVVAEDVEYVRDEIVKGAGINADDPRSEYYAEMAEQEHIYPTQHSKLLLSYIHRYDAMRSIGEWMGLSETALFWLPTMAFLDVDIDPYYHYYSDDNRGRYAAGAAKAMEAAAGRKLAPTYTAKDGRIYQTMAVDGGKLTIIYSVGDGIIEGYYYQ